MTDEAQIHALVRRLGAAWNAGDAAAYAELFTEDADYITFFGWHTEGRAAIAEAHRKLFEGPLKGSRLGVGGGTSKVRLLGTDAAVVISSGGTTLAGAARPDPERDSIVTLTAVRDSAGEWRFASFQNTRRTAPPAGT
jgi:uncharacterized protein (TIGR02246 family)